jgi:Fe-S oxidoreductase
VIKTEGAQHLLDRLGLDYEVLPSGCCGMAGSFGFEAGSIDRTVEPLAIARPAAGRSACPTGPAPAG